MAVAAAALAPPRAGAQPVRRDSVTVSDHLGSGQLEETITVYLGGVQVGTLHVTPDHPDDSFAATVPVMDRLPFTLCGMLLRREPDGTTSQHPIDNGGLLTHWSGAHLDAMTLGDVLFALDDEQGAAETTVQRGPACSAAVS